MNPEEKFQNRIAKLNAGQREAVEAIEGPVMVIAGPGTGKTEVLALRIAYLLRSDLQVSPSEILCLTYTDDATQSMRNRLLDIIGPEANRVQIYTFHAFCNQVIQQNREYFSYGELEPVDDLTRTEIVHEILDELRSDHILWRSGGDIYSNAPRLLRLFSTMKEENYTTEYLCQIIDQEIEELPNREDMKYKRNTGKNKKGDPKLEKIRSDQGKLEKTRGAVELFEVYKEKMKTRGFYDFSDMILWVIRAFAQHQELLLQYQEKCQYILVDEFQDTNGSQNALLRQLLDYWDVPNVFVVGDDDQSVYEFQGARIKNIVEFHDRYRESIRVIMLTENYRSSPPILEWAGKSIMNNMSRLVTQLSQEGAHANMDLSKDIRSAHPRFADQADCPEPRVVQYPNLTTEEVDLVIQVERLIQSGVRPQDIAVLYAQHKQADRILDLMDKKGIPYFVKRPANLLDIPLVKQILNLFRYLKEESEQALSGEATLYQLLHSPFFQVPPRDIARLALFKRLRDKCGKTSDPSMEYWRTSLSHEQNLVSIGLENPEALIRIGSRLDDWLQSMNLLSLPALLEKVVHESGLMGYILKHRDHIYSLEVLKSFYDFVQAQVERKADLSLADFLDLIEKHRIMNIRVPVQRVFSKADGVQFYTAHSSKGNEFEYVFLIGMTSNYWENKKAVGNRFVLPIRLSSSQENERSDAEEVARRLFYVALTRAKKHLRISYSENAGGSGRNVARSKFIDEVCAPEKRELGFVEEELLAGNLEKALQPKPSPQIELAYGRYLEETLSNMRMSTSALSLYLRCPLRFYFERVLKVPQVENDYQIYGSAVHSALKYMVANRDHTGLPPVEAVLGIFQERLKAKKRLLGDKLFERNLEQGIKEITDFYAEIQKDLPEKVEVEKNISFVWDGKISVTGNIDRLDILDGYCRIIDYKTGNPEGDKNVIKPPNPETQYSGSDFWRQMAFYKFLVDENPKGSYPPVRYGSFLFLRRQRDGEYCQLKYEITEQDIVYLKEQLSQAYTQIMNQEFDKGCGREDCIWCQFTQTYKLQKESL